MGVLKCPIYLVFFVFLLLIKVGVWCAMSANKRLGFVFFEETVHKQRILAY